MTLAGFKQYKEIFRVLDIMRPIDGAQIYRN